MRLRGAGLPTGETRRLESRRYGAVGSWVVSYRFCACLGTRNCNEAAAGALASWTAAVLCRFCACGPDLKAPEDWRTPKPGGTAAGSWKASFRLCACIGTMNPPLTPPRRGTDRTRTIVCSPPGRGRRWVGSWKASHVHGGRHSRFLKNFAPRHKSELTEPRCFDNHSCCR